MPHLNAVLRTALAICGSMDRAEDLTQTAFTKALQSFGSFKTGTNCKAWLLRILRNTWLDEMRHRKVAGPEITIDEQLVAQPPEPEPTTWSDAADLLENFSDEDVIGALAELSEDKRLTLYLVDVERLGQEEVAEILGVAVGTVKSRASRARNTLRHRLAAHARDLGFGGR